MNGSYYRILKYGRIFLLLALVSVFIHGAGAGEISSNPISDALHVNINTANGGGYYIKFDGGGLNALHITTGTSDPYGQLTTSSLKSGTFYVSCTGGNPRFNDIILMVAVRKPGDGDEPLPDDLKIRIKSSGYTWPLTGDKNLYPAAEDLTYVPGAVDREFTLSSISYGPQNWKPAGNNDPLNYPIYGDQDMSSDEEFYIFFVDLNVGNLKNEYYALSGLTDNGMVKVEYSIENLDSGLVAFNAYGWRPYSNQEEGISWTNAVTGSKASGYAVNIIGSSAGEGGVSSSSSSGSIIYNSDDTAGSTNWKPKVGNLNISSIPEGAMIFIDGEYSGEVTDGTFTDVSAGKYLVHLELEEYESTDPKWIEVRNGYVTEEHFNLTLGTGSCFVSSVPQGADIYLDWTDTLWHTDSVIHGITSGNHTISVYMEGYGELSENVTIKTGEVSSISFSFDEGVVNSDEEIPPAASGLQYLAEPDNTTAGDYTKASPAENELPAESGLHDSIFAMILNFFFKSDNSEVSAGPVKSAPGPVKSENTTSALIPLDQSESDNLTVSEISEGAVGRLYVTSYPTDLYITIDGKKTDYKTPNMFYGLKEGYHDVSVTDMGETPKSAKKEVWISSDEDSLVHLEPMIRTDKYLLTVESRDFKNSGFMVDGKYPEYSFPSKISLEKTGAFLTVFDDGKYYSYYADSDYEGSVLKLSRTENFGTVNIYTKPEGAEVFIDSHDTGVVTPCIIGNISGGSHVIRVSKDGYCPQEKEIFLVNTGNTIDEELRFVLDDYSYGNLFVDSTPRDAMIYLRGTYTGIKTPYTFNYLPIGDYDVEIVYNRTVYDTGTVTIEPWQKNPLIEYNVTLEE